MNNEMIEFLSNYVRIKTVHPQPDYQQALALFKKQAEKDGFDYQEIILPSGNPVLVISYPGSDVSLKALALNHHMDVVPAPNEHDWKVPPFSGTVCGDTFIGRGVQDMKGIGVMHYFALKAMKEQGIKPTRTIHCLLVPDEERGGFQGTQEFINTEEFKKLNIGFVLDEGRSSGNPDYLYIKTGERKPMQVTISCVGALAHGSNIMCFNAIHEIIQLLQHVIAEHTKEQQKIEHHEAGSLLSLNITSLKAGIMHEETIAMNVVPDTAHATVDIRVPPHMPLKKMQQFLDDLIKKYPSAGYAIEATVDEPVVDHEVKNSLYQCLEMVVKNRHNLAVEPHISEGASDLRYYLAQGIEGVGFTPFTIMDNIHGTNESVPIVQLVRGKEIFFDFLLAFCAGDSDV